MQYGGQPAGTNLQTIMQYGPNGQPVGTIKAQISVGKNNPAGFLLHAKSVQGYLQGVQITAPNGQTYTWDETNQVWTGAAGDVYASTYRPGGWAYAGTAGASQVALQTTEALEDSTDAE